MVVSKFDLLYNCLFEFRFYAEGSFTFRSMLAGIAVCRNSVVLNLAEIFTNRE